MEIFIYYSIVFFGLIIFFLYAYLIFQKSVQTHKNKKEIEYSRDLIPYIDNLIDNILEGRYLSEDSKDYLKKTVKNPIKRDIIIKRSIYYLENFKGEFIYNITELCEDLGIVDYDIQNLKSPNKYLKALACKRLGEYRSKKSLHHLLMALQLPIIDVRYNSLMALAKIGDEAAFIEAFESINNKVILNERSLIEIVDSFEGDKKNIYIKMISSPNDYLAAIFIKSAGNYMDVYIGEEISKYLFVENKEKRIAAVKALGNMAYSRYVEDIIQLLEDKEWEVRAVAAKVLARFGDDRAVYPLVKALTDRQWYVRFNAAVSILSFDEGIDMIPSIFEVQDKFAKDIIISAIENLNMMKEIELYENSDDENKRKTAMYIKEYAKS
ncbi:PBS lyase HEAT-like repeat protein [Clostridium magnum DSM 2767]|uniref:PBS lyase HEAT-like repeat protein n=1 Tax=Clostridium magnum DSM 2767 TaxID=1121326 RepID=A0A162T1Z3_9CLOT|nr:PBS lyase HEAT-like repeat protein [Clostridium magnum DSM 2767]SHH20356.1 HEAT repeat [Clostridium magnum DSM 2767]